MTPMPRPPPPRAFLFQPLTPSSSSRLVRPHPHPHPHASRISPRWQVHPGNPFVRHKSTTKVRFEDLPDVALDSHGIPRTALPPLVRPLGQSVKGRTNKSVGESDEDANSPSTTTTTTAKVMKPRTRKVKEIADETVNRGEGEGEGEEGGGKSEVGIVSSAGVERRSSLANLVKANLKRFSHAVLLTRVGQFYESYFDPAIEVSKLLSLKLTRKKFSGRYVAFCGFPISQLDKHLETLVRVHGKFVAICEEFKSARKEGGGGGGWVFDRKVVRVVTPGTLIDEPFLNPGEPNFLLSISIPTPPLCAPVPTSAVGEEVDSDERGKEGRGDVEIGISWLDVSTGDFYTQPSSLRNVSDDVARVNPSEIVVEREVLEDDGHELWKYIDRGSYLFSGSRPRVEDEDEHEGENPPEEELKPKPKRKPQTQPKSSKHPKPTDISSTLLLSYVRQNIFSSSSPTDPSSSSTPSIDIPLQRLRERTLQMDANTIQSLEIRDNLGVGGTRGVKGSLVSVVGRTVTSGGRRLLLDRLCSPSTIIQEINSRQSLVQIFHSVPHLREDLRDLLRLLDHDPSRTLQKLSLNRGHPSDLVSIKGFIDVVQKVVRKVRVEHDEWLAAAAGGGNAAGGLEGSDWDVLVGLVGEVGDHAVLGEMIGSAVDDEGLRRRLSQEVEEQESFSSAGGEYDGGGGGGGGGGDGGGGGTGSLDVWGVNEVWVIRPQFSKPLTALHEELQACRANAFALENKLRRKYGSPDLSLKVIPKLGAVVHVRREHGGFEGISRDSKAVLVRGGKSTKCYSYQDWTIQSAAIVAIKTRIRELEQVAFQSLCTDLLQNFHSLKRNARIVDELDVALGFAELAREMGLIRPKLNSSTSLRIEAGRHPTVEQGLRSLNRPFSPNSLSLTPPGSHLHVITGPNMGGKSTFLRQTALITILAQTGSFVPADHVELGVVDRVFTRIGAKDDLFRDRSTFMVEMLETANILRNATEKSLVIMDEVGRGSATSDGIAISYATVNHLLKNNRSRCLFATHFHELADMLGHGTQDQAEGVAFFCTDVDEEEDGSPTYSHVVRPGVNRDSHGLTVARLAGMPKEAIGEAHKVMARLRRAQEKGA